MKVKNNTINADEELEIKKNITTDVESVGEKGEKNPPKITEVKDDFEVPEQISKTYTVKNTSVNVIKHPSHIGVHKLNEKNQSLNHTKDTEGKFKTIKIGDYKNVTNRINLKPITNKNDEARNKIDISDPTDSRKLNKSVKQTHLQNKLSLSPIKNKTNIAQANTDNKQNDLKEKSMSLNIIRHSKVEKGLMPSKIANKTKTTAIHSINEESYDEVAYKQPNKNSSMTLSQKQIRKTPLRQHHKANKTMTQDNSMNLHNNLGSKVNKNEFQKSNITNSEIEDTNTSLTRPNMRSPVKKRSFKASRRAMHSDVRVKTRHKLNRTNNEIDSSKRFLTRNVRNDLNLKQAYASFGDDVAHQNSITNTRRSKKMIKGSK